MASPGRTRAGDAPLPPLLPAPRRAERRPGGFRLRDGIPLVLPPGASDSDFRGARAFAAAVRQRCSVSPAIEGHAHTGGLGPHLELARDGNAAGREGDAHRLSVDPERVVASGSGPAGLRYALETLAQLVDARGRIPCCRVEDAPDLALRGIMLDVSRGKVPTLDTLRALVDLCLRLKLNLLMLYTEHTFRFRRHPKIGAGASPLTGEQMRELDLYAADRHVDLVPCLQSLGHMEHVLRIPRYAKLAETPRRWTISPSVPETYALLEDLYSEYLPNFRSRWFNANCDEPFDLEQGLSRERAGKLGPGGVFLEHVERVRQLAREHGKRSMIWADVVHAHPDRVPELHREIVLLDWAYEARHDYDRVAIFSEHGLDFLVCPGTSSWNCLFPRIENSLANIEGHAAAGRRHGALGLLVTDWGDFGHYNLLGNSWLGFAWAAQQAWSGGVPARDFDRAFSRQLFGDPSGVCARLYRELGALHDAGFAVPNASPVQFLFFDELDHAYFIQQAREDSVARLLRRVERLLPRLAAARDRFARERLTHEELEHAARATRFALRKTRRAREYLAWRRDPRHPGAAGRRRLARSLRALAEEQRRLGGRLERLWLARSAPSNFEFTRSRIDRAIQSLRRAASALERGRAPAPPPAPETLSPARVVRILRGED